jgi:hypothetical protein
MVLSREHIVTAPLVRRSSYSCYDKLFTFLFHFSSLFFYSFFHESIYFSFMFRCKFKELKMVGLFFRLLFDTCLRFSRRYFLMENSCLLHLHYQIVKQTIHHKTIYNANFSSLIFRILRFSLRFLLSLPLLFLKCYFSVS